MDQEPGWYSVYDSESDQWLGDDGEWGDKMVAAEFDSVAAATQAAKDAKRPTPEMVVMGDYGQIEL
jgi:hypothetical protein